MKIRSNFKIICIFLSLIIFYGCNEEIADEVKQSEDISSASGNSVSYAGKGIRLTHKMDSELSYVLHKEGSISSACEIASPALGFDADTYDKTDSSYALDCILDVQELDLYFNGADFDIQVDQYLCEYVAYAPLKFFQFMPGFTNDTIYKVTCDEACAEQRASYCDVSYRLTDGNYATYTSGATFSDSFEGSSVCYFDYSTDETYEEGPNCDEGKVTIRNFELRADSTTTDPDGNIIPLCSANPDIVELESVEEECGGDVYACMNGPAVDFFEDKDESLKIYENKDLNQFTQSFSHDAPIEKDFGTNRYLANYSRVCADTSTDKSVDTTYETLDFKGYEYEDHRYFAGSNKSGGVDFDGDGLNDGTAYANSSFRGLMSASPYYAFYCLDQALDIKAQIRLFIREWDRNFDDTNTYLAKVSDRGQATPANSLIDNYSDQAANYPWNNVEDWDDFLIGSTPAYDANNIFLLDQCGLEQNEFTINNFIRESL